MKLLLVLYNIFFPAVLLILLPGAIWRMWKRGNYAHKFGQRFAWYSARTRSILRRDRGRWIWIHAVSVGEVLIALKLIQQIQKDHDVPVLLSTTTSTGFQLAHDRRGAQRMEIIYHPVDFWLSAKVALRTIRPAALILVEAEVWPNLTYLARRKGTPVVLVNARLSARSERRYRAVRWLAARLFGQLDAVCLQDPADTARFVGLGVHPDRTRVTGSIKFDGEEEVRLDVSACRAVIQRCGWHSSDPVLLAASTHPGEELAVARVFQKLKDLFPELRLIIVPRHVERSAKIAAELTAVGLVVARRNHLSNSSAAQVLLVDCTGELHQWTHLATVVFIGKSLLAQGGQNPAEAIAAGKPVVFGPHMQNFSALVDLVLSHEGACQIHDEADLAQKLQFLLSHRFEAEAMATRAIEALAPHRGATRRTWEAIRSLPRDLVP